MIDEHMEYFVHMRMNCPSFTAHDALSGYFAYQPMEAIDLVFDYVEDGPFDHEDLEGFIEDKDGWDAFELAYYSDFDIDADRFWFDGGLLVSMDDEEYEKWCIEYVMDKLADDIIRGEIEVSNDLQEILALWGPDGMELCKEYMRSRTVGSRNAKGRRFRR